MNTDIILAVFIAVCAANFWLLNKRIQNIKMYAEFISEKHLELLKRIADTFNKTEKNSQEDEDDS